MQLIAQFSGRFVKGWVGGSVSRSSISIGSVGLLCLCGFSVNENAVLWTFQSLFGYC